MELRRPESQMFRAVIKNTGVSIISIHSGAVTPYQLKVRRINYDHLGRPLSRNCISFQIVLGKRHTYVTQIASIRCVQICLCRQADSGSLGKKLGDYMSVLEIAFIKRGN